MQDNLMDLFQQLPWYGDMLIVMGFLRVIFKPTFTILNAIVQATPSDKDNRMLADLRATSTYRIFVWVMDFFASVKVK